MENTCSLNTTVMTFVGSLGLCKNNRRIETEGIKAKEKLK